MATIVIEDGTAKTNSNSYVTEAEVTTYASDRGITLTATEAVLIIKAMDYLETLSFIGYKKTEDQALQWPRDQVYIDNFYIESDTIPQELKNAQLALCMSIDAGVDPASDLERTTKREKVGDIEVEYRDTSASRELATKANYWLRKLVKGSVGGSGFMVSRG